jgi:hypothetical protein
MFSGKITGRIFTSRDPFTITVRTVFDNPGQINRHKSYYFILAGFVPTVAFDGMLHDVSLTYIYNAIARKRVYTIKKIGSEEPIFGSFCYEVFPTLSGC